MLLVEDKDYKKGFKFDHVWPILKGIEKFANSSSNTESPGPNFPSSSSFSTESPATPGMNSFDLNMNDQEGTCNSSGRPMGVKKAKRQQKEGEEFKKMMEKNNDLVRSIKDTSFDRIELQRQKNELRKKKIELAQMKEENKILFMNLDTVSDPNMRVSLEKEKEKIMQKRAQTAQDEEQWGGSEYYGSQYRASNYQRDQAQEDQAQEDQANGEQVQGDQNEDFTQYYNLLGGTGNNFPGF